MFTVGREKDAMIRVAFPSRKATLRGIPLDTATVQML